MIDKLRKVGPRWQPG